MFPPDDPDRNREIGEKFKGKKINTPVLNPILKKMELVVTYEQTLEQEKAERMAFGMKLSLIGTSP